MPSKGISLDVRLEDGRYVLTKEYSQCLWLFAVRNVIGGLKSMDVFARTSHPKCA